MTTDRRLTAVELAREIAGEMGIAPDIPMADEQAAEFRERLEAELQRQRADGALKRHEIRILPPGRILTQETVRELLRDHLTVLGPGEVLILRTVDWTAQQAREYQRVLDRWHADGNLPFRAFVVHGDEMAVVRPGEPEARVDE